YEEVFAPVARIKAIRLFLAYASFMGFTVFQMDVKSTFLYGTIDEEVYIQQSPLHDSSSPLHPTKTTKTLPTSTPTAIPTLRQYARRATRITQSKSLPTAADEPASLFRDDSEGEALPTVSGLEAEQDRENIIKTSALPHDSTPRVTSLDADEGRTAKVSGDDALIKGRSLEIGDEAGVERSTERGSNDTEELVNVLTSLDEANILTSGVQAVSVPPAAKVSAV
nr:putative ribonuclease H-like domain-containing protein [Tanacetum cinerariifolium]